MDRMTTAEINGVKRYLNYSVAVMFDMVDKFGNIRAALDVIGEENKESFEAVRWFAVKMVNDAELCRREAGYDPQPMLSEDEISLHMSPLDYALLKAAVVDAISSGYVQETTSSGKKEIDLGLEELRAKKAEAGE